MRGITTFILSVLMMTGPLAAFPPLASVAPLERPDTVPEARILPASVERRAPSVEAVSRSLRPILRGAPGAIAAAVPPPPPTPNSAAGSPVSSTRPGLGISAGTFDRAFDGVQLQERIVERDRNQAEFSRTLWDYLDSAVSDARISNGRSAVAEHRETLQRIERRYRVEAEVVAAIWGLESAYGASADRPTSSRPWRRWLMTGAAASSSRRS
jgi:membrane-bound lytic murein transglycosylase B